MYVLLLEKAIRLFDFDEQSVTGLLGISQEHGGVLLVEDWVVYCRIANSETAFHHHCLLPVPHLCTYVCNVWSKGAREMCSSHHSSYSPCYSDN